MIENLKKILFNGGIQMKKIFSVLLAILLLTTSMVFANSSNLDGKQQQQAIDEVKRSVELFFNKEYNSLLREISHQM